MHPSLNKRLQSTALHLKRLVRTSSRGGRIHTSSAPLLQMSGALVQHAEAVMSEIGTERVPIVRELFRNLVTGQGTRNVLDRGHLLSVFADEDRAAATEVLGQLTAARLLTTYEVKDEDGNDHHRVEIVHESLPPAAPRPPMRAHPSPSARSRTMGSPAAGAPRAVSRSWVVMALMGGPPACGAAGR